MPRRRMAVRRPRRAYYPVRRYYRMGRRYARRAYYGYRRQNAFRFSAPLPWLAGIVVGLTDFDDKIPAELQDKAKIENNIITFQKKDIYEYLGFTKTPFSRIIKDKRFIKYAIDSRQICYIISKDEQVIVDDIECNNRQMKFIFKS